MNRRASSKLRHSCGDRRGVALVIILAFLVLLVGVVLAFFARAMSERQVSNSSANQTKAEILAQGALDQILGDLKQEIADGSTEANIGTSTIYTPTSGTNMVPQLAGSSGTGGMENLLKRSAYGIPFSAGGIQRAANVSTLSKSQNGRFIPPARWNKPLLLPKSDQSATNDIDWTPLGATGAGWASAPDWIYVARDGSNPTSWNANLISTGLNPTAVVGRFAYMVYDVGGLLDMNAAGYPSKATAAQIGGKSGLAYADLTQLTDSAGTQLLSNSQIDNLVGWRNFASASTDWTKTPPVLSSPALSGFPGSGTAGWTNAPAAAANYFNYTLKNKKGYLETENPLLNSGQSDRLFVSRQELMRLLLGNIASQAATTAGKTDRAKVQNALQYLGTFSRALTTPNWGPTYNAAEFGGNAANAYKDKADDPAAVNRNLPGVRRSAARTIRHYSDDGTFEDIALKAGSPLVRTRFSLAKLAWIGHNGPNASAFDTSLSSAEQATAIQDCFGLTWNSANKRWDYDHGAKGILTLDEVLGEGREPDFFELLKAGILEGSLGGHPGEIAEDPTFDATTPAQKRTYWEGPMGRHYETYSADRDRHILQIGANIIDQADNNNFPTAVYLELYNQGAYSSSQNAFNNTVFGLENLPMLQAFALWVHVNGDEPAGQQVQADKDVNKDGVIDEKDTYTHYPVANLGVWLVPEMWNPNDPSTAGTGLSDPKYPTPEVLRAVTFGKAYVWNVRADSDMNNALDPSWTDPGAFGYDPGVAFPPGTQFGSEPINFGNDMNSPSVDGIVCFKNPRPTSTAPKELFSSPLSMQGTGDTQAQYNYFDSTSASGAKNHHPNGANWLFSQSAGRRFMGIFLGEVPHDGDLNGFTVRSIPDSQLSVVFEYYDGASWRPYTAFNRVESLYDASGSSGSRWGTSGRSSSFSHYDPRTDRFSGSTGRTGAGQNPGWKGGSIRHGPGKAVDCSVNATLGADRSPIFAAWPRTSAGFTHRAPDNLGLTSADTSYVGEHLNGFLFDDWTRNITDVGWTGSDFNKPRFWYVDPDGVTRPGDGWRASAWEAPTKTGDTGDGMMVYHRTGDAQTVASEIRRRPVILNRPFRSVGELGYVFRDLPFKTLDLWSEQTADAGLLDLFSVRDEPVVVAGQVNPNAASPKVIQAIIARTLKHEGETATLDTSGANSDAESLANEISSWLKINPLVHRGDWQTPDPALGAGVADPLSEAIQRGFANSSASATAKTANKANKAYAEAPLRALASVTNTRTWNLMIDVIAQSGIFPPNAQNLASSFIVQGERRFWLHVAIDRLTGEVVDQQLEPVYE